MLQDTPSFLAYWRNARARTVRVLDALAPEDLEWAPPEAPWHTRST